jgi:hypothetical protein
MFDDTFRAEPSADPNMWQVTPSRYRYALLDANGAEILAYHWHPSGTSQVDTPHLHVSARHANLDLSPLHLPTGTVTPISFVRALIAEFGVEPLRTDWDAILSDG